MTSPELVWQSRLRPVLLEMAVGTPPEDALLFLPMTSLDGEQTESEMRCLVRATSPAIHFLHRTAPDLTSVELADELAELLEGIDDEGTAMLEDLVVDLSTPVAPGQAFRSLRDDSRATVAGLGNLLLAAARYLSPALGYPPEAILEGFFAFAENRLDDSDDL